MSPRDLLRVVAGAMALTLGPGLLSASCSAHESGTIAPGYVGVEDDASVDGHVSATPTCAPPAGAVAQCAGSSASLTFYPPLQCATPHDAGTDDASDAGDAAAVKDPCSGISPDDTFFTPTACRSFAGAEASGLVVSTSATNAPSWNTPNDGDVLTADEWAIFAWKKGATTQRGPLQDALDFLEPSAHAFTPLGGDAYVIEFTVDCVEILRVALSVTAWTPDPASWAILVSQTKPIAARVVAMKFVDDALAPGTAPTMSAPITFSIAR